MVILVVSGPSTSDSDLTLFHSGSARKEAQASARCPLVLEGDDVDEAVAVVADAGCPVADVLDAVSLEYAERVVSEAGVEGFELAGGGFVNSVFVYHGVLLGMCMRDGSPARAKKMLQWSRSAPGLGGGGGGGGLGRGCGGPSSRMTKLVWNGRIGFLLRFVIQRLVGIKRKADGNVVVFVLQRVYFLDSGVFGVP